MSDSDVIKEEPKTEMKDFRFERFTSFKNMQNSFATRIIPLTDEEIYEREVVVGFLPKREVLPTEELKNPSVMKRVLFLKGSSLSMREAILHSSVPLNGVQQVADMKIFSKVIEYNGKCVFCNFNHTEDKSLLCYQCVKMFNDCEKFISPEEVNENV